MLDGRPTPLTRRLAAHLAALDLPKGTHLIEQSLADSMLVSRTPIRRALAEFERAGIVFSEPRRGYFLAVPSRSLFTSGLDFEVEDQDGLFEKIALDRLSVQLGDEFSEADIIKRYNVSSRLAQRTLQTLRDESVIEVAGRGIWRFNPFLLTEEATQASFAFRLIIEPASPLQPTFKPRRDLIRRCRDEHMRLLAVPAHERSGRLAFRVDAMFHDVIATCSNNPFIQSSVAHQNRLRRLMEYKAAAQEDHVFIWVREHLDILDAINTGMNAEASALLAKHLRNAMDRRAPPETP